jgi:hypothetical protein
MSRSAFFVLLAALAAAPQKSTFVVPNFRDTTITTRVTHGLMLPTVTTLRLKGPRQRNESHPESARPSQPFMAHILQCDQQTGIRLFEHSKTYRLDHWHEPAAERRQIRPVKPADRPEVTVTISAVDTGERRTMGSYEAHHVKTTITVNPGKDAASKPSRTDIDGWYVDLPGLNCRTAMPERFPPFIGGWIVTREAGGHDHLVYKFEGTAPRGYAVEETSTERSGGNVVVNKTELLEFSEQPLDESLFEVPEDYTPGEANRTGVVERVPVSPGLSPQ